MSEGEILILEDDALISMGIEKTLAEAGYKQLSVHSNANAALTKIKNSDLVAALLDFNLGQGGTNLAIAEELQNQSIPFVFLTGYTNATVAPPDGLSTIQRIAKSFKSDDLVDVVNEMVCAPSGLFQHLTRSTPSASYTYTRGVSASTISTAGHPRI